METIGVKTQNCNPVVASKSTKSADVVSDRDSRRRAYNIYLKKSINFTDELWELLRGQIPIQESGT
jgi:hypothetical protein